MKKIILSAAFLAAMFSAKAQSIRIFNSCSVKESRIVNFVRADRYSNVLQSYAIGSVCPNLEMPINRLETGNYEFYNLNIQDNEEWFMVLEKNGESVRREPLTKKGFWLPLGPGERLTITIAQKLMCNCSK